MSDVFDDLVAKEWRQAFDDFIKTGELTPEFEQYLNANEKAQKAVDIAFRQEAESLARMLQAASKPALDATKAGRVAEPAKGRVAGG